MKKYNIGIDLGGTKILCGLIDSQNQEIVYKVKKKTKKDKTTVCWFEKDSDLISGLYWVFF